MIPIHKFLYYSMSKFEQKLHTINASLKQYTSYQPSNYSFHMKTGLRFECWWTGSTIVISWLKHGHQWMLLSGFEGGQINLILNKDGTEEYQVAHDYNNIGLVLNKIKEGTNPIVVLSRDPLKYIYSGLSQAILGSRQNIEYAAAFKKHDPYTVEWLEGIDKTKWFAEGYLTNNHINTYNKDVNEWIKKYLRFVLIKFPHSLLRDAHVKNPVSATYYHLLQTIKGSDVTIVDIDLIDKRDDITEFLYERNLLTTKQNLSPSSTTRHSNKAMGRLLREVLKDFVLPDGYTYLSRMDREILDFSYLKSRYSNLWI